MPENARIRQSRGKVYLEVKGSNGWSSVGAEVDILSTLVTIADEYFASDGVIKFDDSELIATGDRIYMDVDAVHDTPPFGLQGTIVLNPP